MPMLTENEIHAVPVQVKFLITQTLDNSEEGIPSY